MDHAQAFRGIGFSDKEVVIQTSTTSGLALFFCPFAWGFETGQSGQSRAHSQLEYSKYSSFFSPLVLDHVVSVAFMLQFCPNKNLAAHFAPNPAGVGCDV